MRFYKNKQQIELSKTEQRLLRLLIENAGNTLTRNSILQIVWEDSGMFVDENALSVSIRRLRKKLGDNLEKPRYIKTIYGIGYRWVVEE